MSNFIYYILRYFNFIKRPNFKKFIYVLIFFYILFKLRKFTQMRHLNLVLTPNKNRKFIKTSFGNIAYISKKPAKKIKGLIVIIPGFNDTADNLYEYCDIFVKNKYCVIIFDLCGRGYSDSTIYPNDPQILSSMISQCLFSLKITSKFHILGYSMGGLVASEFSKNFPHLVKSLILVGPAGIKTNLPFIVKNFNFYPIGELLTIFVGELLLKRHSTKINGEEIAEQDILLLKKQHCNKRALFSSLLSSIRYMPWNTYNFSSITVKKFVIYSLNDGIIDINDKNIHRFGDIVSLELKDCKHRNLIKENIAKEIVKYIDKNNL